MLYTPNLALLPAIRAALAPLDLYWVLGGAASGKSSVCEALARRHALRVYDLDAAIYGTFMPRYSAERHPAATAYFRAENPLAWVLALDWEAFDALNRATTVEYLDLFAQDVATAPSVAGITGPLVADGGLTHPSLLAQVLPAECIVCLAVDPAISAAEWNTQPERVALRDEVLALPEGAAAWARFLDFDRRMAQTMVDEARALGITVFDRGDYASPAALAQSVAARWGL
jgi:hypothetical protein